MAGPATKTAGKKPPRRIQTELGQAPERVSKRKVGVLVVEKATEIQAATVDGSHASVTKVTPPARKAKRAKKEKVVRDSFTMPKSDYEKIAALKQKCADNGISVKKSELLRAGLLMLAGISDGQLAVAVGAVETVKTGRPAKG